MLYSFILLNNYSDVLFKDSMPVLFAAMDFSRFVGGKMPRRCCAKRSVIRCCSISSRHIGIRIIIRII